MIDFKPFVPGGTNQNFNDPAIRPELLERVNRIAQQAKKAKVEVKNIYGTSRYPHPKEGGTWIDHWLGHLKVRKLPKHCPACGEGEFGDLVGAHVQKTQEADKKWYIVPICSKCNVSKEHEIFEIDEDYLVPVSPESL